MTQRHGILLTAAFACLLAALPALADAPTAPAAEPPAEALAALPDEEGGACALPTVPAATELPAAALLPVEPIPAWCPHNEPCFGGSCLDYPDCPVAVCDGGICRYW